MTTPMLLPYTLLTAAVLAVIAFAIGLRISRVRFITDTISGDGGIPLLSERIEGQAAFTAYVPLLLILMALLELGDASRYFLVVYGVLLVVFRLLQLAGNSPRSRQRALGELGSSLLLLAGAAYGLFLSINAL